MANKKSVIIAHELGHAIAAMILDVEFDPVAIEISPKGSSAQAYCHLTSDTDDEDRMKKGNMSSVKDAKKLADIVDLGGIFGELIYAGEWDPWGSRSDLDEFTSTNRKRKSPLIDEIFEWMWNDEDELSFISKIREHKDRILKYESTLDFYDTMVRLPYLWSVYIDFCGKIDRKEFKNVVNEMNKSKSNFIEGKELKAYLNRIIIREESNGSSR